MKIPIGSPYMIPSHFVGKAMFMAIFRARSPSWDSNYSYVKGLAKGIQIDLRNRGVRVLEGKFGDFVEDEKTKTISIRTNINKYIRTKYVYYTYS